MVYVLHEYEATTCFLVSRETTFGESIRESLTEQTEQKLLRYFHYILSIVRTVPVVAFCIPFE